MAGWKRLFRLDESPRHLNRNIDEELEFHIEGRIDELVAGGMTEDEARAEAVREFGGLDDTKARLETIDERRLRRRSVVDMISAVARDVRFSVRSYIKRPGFALTVVFIIGLGVGATATIFSIVDGVLIRRLPYPEANRLVYFDNAAHPVPKYRDWEARSRGTIFSSIAATLNQSIDYTEGESPERLSGIMATSDLLPMLGAGMAIGRLFTPEEYIGMPQVAILSWSTWQRVFGGKRDVLGKTVTMSGFPVVIIGVLDPDFQSPAKLMGGETDVWLPLDITLPNLQRRNYYILEVAAKLKPGVSMVSARASLDQIAVELAETDPEMYAESDGTPEPIDIIPLQSAFTGRVSFVLLLVLGAVGLLLAIGCTNVANLFLARGTDRVHEVGLRYSLGASRRRIVSQLLTESAVLSLAGGLLGVLVAFGGVRTFEVLNPGGIPMADRIGVDVRVLVFALLLSLLTGLFFGLAPAWRASRMDMSSALKDSGPGSVGGRRKARLRSTLVVTEIALALVLLAGAGLLFNSFLRMRAVDPGFDTDGIAIVPLRLEDEVFNGEQKLRFSDSVLERLAGFPGVESATFSYSVPFMFFGGTISGSFSSSWYNDEGEEVRVRTQVNPVTRDYFTLLGAEFRGRVFGDTEIDMDPQPVVISGELAGRLYPGKDAIGRQFSSSSARYVVIGVVSGLHHWGLDRGADASIYIPWKMMAATSSRHTLMVRTAGDPGALLPVLRDIIWQVEPGLPITESFSMNDRINQSLMGPRFISLLFLTFATLAILLAAGGIYGSMLYNVKQRRRELGIRAALGADRGHIIRMVLGQGALLTSIGILIGLAGALAVSTALESLIFGISTTDLPTFLIVVALLGSVAMVATFIPARKAVASDPVEVLRQE